MNSKGSRNPRLASFGTNIFSEMTLLAERFSALNLGQGFPDIGGPDQVVESAVSALRGGHHQYPPVAGIYDLRAAIADHQREWYGLVFDPVEEVLVTTGASEALAAALLAFVAPGDEVIALEPYYDSYAACTVLAGGTLVPVRIRPPDYTLDVAALRAAVTDRTRMLLVNSPHNPTGAVLTPDELSALAAVAQEYDLIVVADEVYEHLVYDGGVHSPLIAQPGMRERTISVGSAGKTFSFTGWKVGWVTGPADLVASVRTVKQYLSFASGTPFQLAISDALHLPRSYYDELRSDLQRRRDLLTEGLRDVGFVPYTAKGSYFITADISELGETDSMKFCRELPERCGVVAIPNSVFYADAAGGQTEVRFTFCKPDEFIIDALERLDRGLR